MKCYSIGCRNKEDFRREGSYRICNVCGHRMVVLSNDIKEVIE